MNTAFGQDSRITVDDFEPGPPGATVVVVVVGSGGGLVVVVVVTTPPPPDANVVVTPGARVVAPPPEGVSTETACTGWVYVKVIGPFPLTTAAGGAAAALVASGAVGVTTSAWRAKPGSSRRIRGATSAALGGLGAAVLLQQFAVVALTTPVLVGLPLGVGLIGLSLSSPPGRIRPP